MTNQYVGLLGGLHAVSHTHQNQPGPLTDYLAKHKALFDSGAIPVDVIIGPEQLVTRNIEQLIANPGSLQVLDFADGRIRFVAVKAVTGGPIVGRELQEIREHMPRVDTRVAAIFRRGGDPIIPEGLNRRRA